ncbi:MULTISPECIES: hypothetical protein [unclassified Streptomyces]|uniref:hypothetical protein n=1 Tax=unclassified Streptomyces TaxID=2593676 RepID=UPI0038303BA3
MDTDELLALLVRHRAELRRWLDGEQYADFLSRLELLRAAGDDPVRVRRVLTAVVGALWPLPDTGELGRALHASGLRGHASATAAVPTADAVLAALEALYAAPAAGEQDTATAHLATPPGDGAVPGPRPDTGPDPAFVPDAAVDPAAVLAAARRRLLGEPSRAAAPAGSPQAGQGPADVIVLTDPEDGRRSPEFQFDPDTGRPRDIVVQINRMLLADRDPWGAADWWLGGNTWLGGRPAALLGQVPDALLADAARALVEEDGR